MFSASTVFCIEIFIVHFKIGAALRKTSYYLRAQKLELLSLKVMHTSTYINDFLVYTRKKMR